ncbi:MAG: TraB/GumN family protein [Ferruginibacter sp.]
MRVIVLFLLFAASVLNANSQPAKKTEKKYQGLLWEITGNGLTRPSYLFGTMHVSNKLAFHLADSFFIAIKSVDVVALETNPANWQEDYSKPNIFSGSASRGVGDDYLYSMFDIPNDYMRKNSFAVGKYENNVKLALATEPAMINGMLYRTYNYGADFEEDTYLDMYIFQTGSKLGKKMAGVENFEESEKLVAEAYKDAAKERRNSKRLYDEDYSYEDNIKNPYTIEDAYRKGDLDMLDSLEQKQFNSKAFLEKFLYKRNEIQAGSIDSIIKSKTSLFVGVGSAHLPGKRGVIEMLRAKGYKLRAVKMGVRDGAKKDAVDRIRVPVNFKTVFAADSAFSVEIPGDKFYSFSKLEDLNTKQYADMGNGAYYVVSRVKTNGLLLGEDENTVYRKVDSLLYENIPGKILKKSAIIKNGYKGFDITNRTRRGDVQRYNIFITPFEVLLFKMSGIGDYVAQGSEALKFFSSVNIKQAGSGGWVKYTPSGGGFTIKMPHVPVMQKDFNSDRLEYTATDKNDNTTYALFRASIHNYSFIEEDSFDLNLMDESYASSEMVEKQTWRQQGRWHGYPSLECRYKHKDGSYSTVRYLVQGPNYYAQVARYKAESKNVKMYFDSMQVIPFVYPTAKLRTDTAMKFTVKSPVFPDDKKNNDIMESIRNMMGSYYTDEEEEADLPKIKFKTIGTDTTGEKIFVAYMQIPRNSTAKDSLEMFDSKGILLERMGKEQSYIYLKKDSGVTASGYRYMYQQVTDTGSSRTIISKAFNKGAYVFALVTETDTLTPRSSLLTNFIESFTPADSLSAASPYAKRNAEFFKNFASKDSATHARAMKMKDKIRFDTADLPLLKTIIDTLSWQSKDYLQTKQDFISELGSIKDSTLTGYLKGLYLAAKDTADLQNTILETLLDMQTTRSFTAFKDLVILEPPVVTDDNGIYRYNEYSGTIGGLAKALRNNKRTSYEGEWAPLYDSLALTRVIFPDILQLVNLDEYKGTVLELLTTMTDSGYLDAKAYEQYLAKFYVEAKQELKRERAKESQLSIAKAEKANKADADDDDNDDPKEDGNQLLESYAVLLLPYWDKHPGVPVFFDDIMKLKNREIRFNIMLLLMRNKKAVPDSLLNGYAADEHYRIVLYRKLKKAKLLDRFPAQYFSQAGLVKSALLANTSYYNKYDTLVLLDKLPAVSNGKKGLVYFYKYKTKKTDKKWKIVSFGLQPENEKAFDDDNDDFASAASYSYNRDDDNKLDEEKPVREQLEQKLKTMLYKMHKSAARFYDNSLDEYKDIITEKIKSNRFGD